MKLFCLPHAGGNADFFNEMAKQINLAGVDVFPFEYAGHGERCNEKFCHSIQDMASDMINFLLQKLSVDDEYCLFGYSMGCLVVLEMVRQIVSNYYKPPKHIFIAAHEPKVKRFLYDTHEQYLVDEEIRREVSKLGGIPEKLLTSDAFWRIYLPLYRSDYNCIWNYDFEEVNFSTISATVFFSENESSLEDMIGWNKFFLVKNFYGYKGTHFFIKEYYKEISEVIINQINQYYV